MKKIFAMMLATACTLSFAQAQDEMQSNDNTPSQMRERGGKRGERGMMGMSGMGMSGMGMMNDARSNAESALAKKAPDEFAALAKEREALEAKFQALAKKNSITLPMTAEAKHAQMEAFNKKYEKELAAIREQMKTDPKGAMEKMQALFKAEGIEMPLRSFRGGAKNGEGAKNGVEAKSSPRANRNQELRQAVRKAYPEEFKKIEELRRDNPDEARKQMKALMDKFTAEHKVNDKASTLPPPPPAAPEAE